MNKAEWFIRRENEILKELLKQGFFYMNYQSTDCDGCSSQSHSKYESLEEFYLAEADSAEWSDGSFSYTLATRREDGKYDLNEYSSGGSWGNY